MAGVVTRRPQGGLAQRMRGWCATALAALALTAALPLMAQKTSSSANAGTMQLKIWFGNPSLNLDNTSCKAVFPVMRQVPRSAAVATASLRALFAGPTAEEKAAGYHSPFSDASAGLLKSIHIRSGTAYVQLNDQREALSGATSSCGAAEFQAQVQSTLLQLPTIKRVIFAIDGQPRTFYEWMNEACGPQNDHCDARPFVRRR